MGFDVTQQKNNQLMSDLLMDKQQREKQQQNEDDNRCSLDKWFDEMMTRIDNMEWEMRAPKPRGASLNHSDTYKTAKKEEVDELFDRVEEIEHKLDSGVFNQS